jgi:hypothetical protein
MSPVSFAAQEAALPAHRDKDKKKEHRRQRPETAGVTGAIRNSGRICRKTAAKFFVPVKIPAGSAGFRAGLQTGSSSWQAEAPGGAPAPLTLLDSPRHETAAPRSARTGHLELE